MVVQLQCDDPLLRWSLGEYQPDAGLVLICLAVGRVVHLKNKIRSGRNELRYTIRPLVGRTARRVYQQKIAGSFVSFAPLLRIAQC